MEHTPGPWTCHSGSVYKDAPDVYPKGPNTGMPIAHMDRETGNGTLPVERDANAKLIAAAPELLDACQGAVTAMRQLVKRTVILPAELLESYSNLREVIAKAEGHEVTYGPIEEPTPSAFASLLEACKLALGFTAGEDLNDDNEIGEVQAVLIAAIKKAEGKS